MHAFVTVSGLRPRPLVIVEDHVYHIERILELVAADFAELIAQMSVVCLDAPGPDTTAAVAGWQRRWPRLQVLASSDAVPAVARLDPVVLTQASAYQRRIAALVRPGGLLLSDVQLETLSFVDRDRWSESIFLANAVRGSFARTPPRCVFMSNKRGFAATFGRDLVEVGFDPRDVLAKDAMASTLVPFLRQALFEAFPWSLVCTSSEEPLWVGRGVEAIEQVTSEVDLVLWPPRSGKLRISGRALASRSKVSELAADGLEATTWTELIAARIAGASGVPVADVGRRVADDDATRAEQSNAAAKHVYALRKRLDDPAAITTADHCYRLRDDLVAGQVTVRSER